MSITLHLRTTATPSEVLEAIRRRAVYWQESLVPPSLRSKGACGVASHVSGETFSLWLNDVGRRPPPTFAILSGTVSESEDGGSTIEARIALPRGMLRSPIYICVVAAFLIVWGTQRWAGPLLLIAALALYVRYLVWDASISRATDEGARHLAERLEQTVADLERASSVSPAP